MIRNKNKNQNLNQPLKYRHVPYYHAKRLEENEEHTEEIKNDPYQGLGVPGRSGFIEVLDSGAASGYANIIIFDGTHRSTNIPLSRRESITYSHWDAIYAEWVHFKALNSWIEYRIHFVPGVWGELITEGG